MNEVRRDKRKERKKGEESKGVNIIVKIHLRVIVKQNEKVKQNRGEQNRTE